MIGRPIQTGPAIELREKRKPWLSLRLSRCLSLR